VVAFYRYCIQGLGRIKAEPGNVLMKCRKTVMQIIDANYYLIGCNDIIATDKKVDAVGPP
jgi:hypothetical protein